MRLMEVAEHPLMVLVNSKLSRGKPIEVDIDTEVEWPDKNGRTEVLRLEPSRVSSADAVMGQLINIEKRGQSLNLPTIVLHMVQAGTGEEVWYYLYEWSLDYLTLKALDGRMVLTNRQPEWPDTKS